MILTASSWTKTAPASGIAWEQERDRVDLSRVVTGRLGPAPGRNGSNGRHWWKCPFHPDRNPSFQVKDGRWRCFGCGASGDAIDFVRRLDGCDFPEAVATLAGRPAPRPASARRPARETRPPTTAAPAPEPPPKPSGLDPEAAAALVDRAAPALWSPDAEDDLRRLRARGLDDDVIRGARVGWTGPVAVPRRDGSGTFQVGGVVIPWFARDGRPALVKIRQPDGVKPKYAEAYRDPARLLCFPGPGVIRPGRPAVLTEGELDCLCLSSLLADLDVAVLTLGSASGRPALALMARLLAAPRWYAAHDADPAGDKAAEAWPKAVRVRPPEGSKDWCDAYAADPVTLLRHWCNALDRSDAPTQARRLKALWPAVLSDPYTQAEREAIQAADA